MYALRANTPTNPPPADGSFAPALTTGTSSASVQIAQSIDLNIMPCLHISFSLSLLPAPSSTPPPRDHDLALADKPDHIVCEPF
jgi:hypothetical protein